MEPSSSVSKDTDCSTFRRSRPAAMRLSGGSISIPLGAACFRSSLPYRPSEKANAHDVVPSFLAQEVQILRRADPILYGGRVRLIGQIIHSSAKREAIAVQRDHPLQCHVQIEIERITMRIGRA